MLTATAIFGFGDIVVNEGSPNDFSPFDRTVLRLTGHPCPSPLVAYVLILSPYNLSAGRFGRDVHCCETSVLDFATRDIRAAANWANQPVFQCAARSRPRFSVESRSGGLSYAARFELKKLSHPMRAPPWNLAV